MLKFLLLCESWNQTLGCGVPIPPLSLQFLLTFSPVSRPQCNTGKASTRPVWTSYEVRLQDLITLDLFGHSLWIIEPSRPSQPSKDVLASCCQSSLLQVGGASEDRSEQKTLTATITSNISPLKNHLTFLLTYFSVLFFFSFSFSGRSAETLGVPGSLTLCCMC